MFNTPVLFLIFNRLDTTQQVFEAMRKVKPRYFYIAADGPRLAKENEDQVCDEVRSYVLSNIDWDCEIKTLFRNENLGCGKAVSEAINWFFENVEEGIILEDDCMPDDSFFKFCSVMLDRYRNDTRLMHIGGTNFQFGNITEDGDYYYSVIPHVWGWATWRRAWNLYKFNLKEVKSISEKKYKMAFNNVQPFIHHFKEIFSVMKKSGIDTWDYQWFYALIFNNGLAVIPNNNLIKNIGFREDGTHTLEEREWNILNIAKQMNSFRAPLGKKSNPDADAYTLREIVGIRPESVMNKNYAKNTLKKIFFRLNKLFKNKKPAPDKDQKF